MFNIGPFELMVLAIVGLIVLGPDKLPELARDAARLLRSLRDMATGARAQLRDELGPEFSDLDLRNLNPKTAIRNAVLGDTDLSSLNPTTALRNAVLGDDEPASGQTPRPPSPPLQPGQPAPFDADAT